MTPRPNLGGYAVLAAFVGAMAWALTTKAAPRAAWVAVSRGDRIDPGLRARFEWTPAMRSALPETKQAPDHYDADSHQWVWLGVGRFRDLDVDVEPIG